MSVFGRRWRVQVGDLDVSDLDIAFEIKRTLRARPGEAKIKIFNLGSPHRAALTTARRPIVQLDPPPLLFRGDARKIEVERDGSDWVTSITAGDGEYAIRTARASTSFAPGTTLADAIRSLGTAMGVGVGNLSSANSATSTVLLEGAVARGPASAELTRLCASAGLSWSVQDGILQLLPIGRALSRVAVSLSPSTGLVESPQRSRGSTVKAKALLLPDLVPGRLVALESEAVRGVFRLEEVSYAGETRGTDWYADLTLRPPRE
ncbi:MAG: hypothetical protein EBU90_26285 [Proteobacteria bacterium]|nr:hypothetical protein [Pseudomonadota bacterium]